MADIPLLTWPVTALVLLGGLVLGTRKRQRKAPQRAQKSAGNSRHGPGIPERWPFTRRRIAGTAERELWQWLRQVFPDHHVFIKVPLARFLTPSDPAEAGAWMRVLAGVYCTFAVCTEDGHVIGCVDLVGAAGLPHGNRMIKQTLLTQCGISYWATGQGQRLNADSLRADFLGLNRDSDNAHELAAGELAFSKSQRIQQTRNRLHETLDRNRLDRDSVQANLENPPSDMMEPASFLTPQQRRRAGFESDRLELLN